MRGHWLLSCYYCGSQLRHPAKPVTEPLRGERVTVCDGHCGAQLYKLARKIQRNDAAIAAALQGTTLRKRVQR